MFRVHQIFIVVFLIINVTNSFNINSCIPNTSCQCYISQYSLKLFNCSHSLSDLPILNAKTTGDITKIIAPSSLTQWPAQLCKYSNLQILDFSGSYFDSDSIDLSCLTQLIHLNLSNTLLTKIPNFKTSVSHHLQILDLSNNQIKILDGFLFQSLNNLLSLFLQNNPIESIENLDSLLNLSNLESVNLISSKTDVTLKQSLTLNQWIDIAKQWNNTKKSFFLRMRNIPLQLILSNPDLFEAVSVESMKIILKTLINSTFITLFNTKKCDCFELRSYQRMFGLVDYQKKYSSPLFQSTTCIMQDGTTHGRLFDRRTYVDLRCPLLGKISLFSSIERSSPALHILIAPFFIVCLLFWQ